MLGFARFGVTYEGLKPKLVVEKVAPQVSFGVTYEGLKLRPLLVALENVMGFWSYL